MLKTKEERLTDLNPQETSEWLEALDQVIDEGGPDRAPYLLQQLLGPRGSILASRAPANLTTPYVNTIPVEEEVPYPGDREMERRIKSLIRWNAAAMVVRAEQVRPQHRRPHLDLCLAGHADRSGLQSLLPRQLWRSARRSCLSSRATLRPASMRARFSKAG